ncbi:MAG: FMN-binding protein [Actinobacteria bacterium]|nr:FMN-binding protein [Actinomycetota bacterium]
MNTHLKKILVSLFVISSFVIYSTYQRFGGQSNIFDNSRTRQTAAESYSDLYASFYKNQTSSNPPNLDQMNTKIDDGIVNNGLYKDGEYDGVVADAFYGTVQVKAIIQSGKLTDVQLLSSPNDRSYSIEINNSVIPILRAEAINIQSAQVDIVSGATNTSNAFIQSLDSALNQAKISSSPVSFLQASNNQINTSNSPVNIVSGATNIVAGPATGTLAAIKNHNGAVNIVSGATNVSTSSTGSSAIQNQNGPVNIVSGATNVSTSSTSGSAITNQNGTVDIVSGATNIGSGTASVDRSGYYDDDRENEDEYEDEYEDD